jgi:hypothetical protein
MLRKTNFLNFLNLLNLLNFTWGYHQIHTAFPHVQQ